ncbi:hypothetical protein GGI07_001170 [Coemansia sp. Benny D115]|nr:hypothetical protein GGI07_001170 [Coemansia sp. Benny D115]
MAGTLKDSAARSAGSKPAVSLGMDSGSKQSKDESVETRLKLSTIGLVQLEDFQRIKGQLEEERRRVAANSHVEESADTQQEPVAKKPKKQGGKKTKATGALSFDDDDDDCVVELRGSKVDALVYVKEDLIIPHHYTFYDFIVNRARGKSGPLFDFDVHDDVRLVHDATKEKDDSHAGKVCERSWYERNKHIFPANRWEVFDPEKNYGAYTIRGSGKRKDK